MKNTIAAISLLLLCTAAAYPQAPRSVLAQGNPPLTQEMVNRVASVYESILGIKFTPTQRQRFQNGEVEYWRTQNSNGIRVTLENVKYYGNTDELESLRQKSTQNTIVESLRRDIQETNDPVSVVIVEAFDNAHRDRSRETSAKGFADLVGNWQRTDFLVADKGPGGGQIGVGYTDTGSLSVMADGSFKLIKVHDHYANGCSRQDAMTETGTVSVNGTRIIFQIKSGSGQTRDGCSRQSQRTTIKAQTATYRWSIRSNPNDASKTMLCINSEKETAECYEKQ